MGGRFLSEFEFSEEAKRVSKRGVRHVENNLLLLEKWTPNSVYLRRKLRLEKFGLGWQDCHLTSRTIGCSKE